MNRPRIKRKLVKAAALTLSFGVALSSFAYAYHPVSEEYSAGTTTGNYLYSDFYEIAPGLKYGKYIAQHDKYGRQTSFLFEYTPGMGTEPVMAYGSYVFGAERISDMASKLREEGLSIVGGINADFFSLQTGIPMSAILSDGIIITSDDARDCLAFREDGSAFIGKPEITLTLTKDDQEFPIAHLNKYPSQYGLYLLDDAFAATTKTKSESLEIVLVPYRSAITAEEYEKRLTQMVDLLREQGVEPPIGDVTEPAFDPTASNAGTEQDDKAAQTEQTEPVETQNMGGSVAPDEYENEAFLREEAAKQLGFTPFGEFYYEFTNAAPQIGTDTSVVVYEMRYDSLDSPIPPGAYVLCADNRTQLEVVQTLEQGDELMLHISGNEEFLAVENAIGGGNMIVKDGLAIEQTGESHYTALNPRSAAGITADGKVLFYGIDGRQKGTSNGLTLAQLSEEMMQLGCTDVLNFDGGGSTTVYSALPGWNTGAIVNSPSDESERRVSDAILFVNAMPPLLDPAELFVYPASSLALKGGSATELGALRSVDANLHPTPVTDSYEPKFFLEDPLDGAIADGYYISADTTGGVMISAGVSTGNGWLEGTAGRIVVVDAVDDFSALETVVVLEPDETFDIQFDASYKTLPVSMGAGNFGWDLTGKPVPVILPEGVDQTGSLPTDHLPAEEEETPAEPELSGTEQVVLQTPSLSANAAGRAGTIDVFGRFQPAIFGESFIISAKYGDKVIDFEVTVLPYPFDDISTHWARNDIYHAFQKGYVNGEAGQDGVLYSPDREFTKAEFCAVLVRLLGLDPTQYDEVVLPYADADQVPEWSVPYLKTVYANGFMDLIAGSENGVSVIQPDHPIDRLDVMAVIGSLSPEISQEQMLLPYADMAEVPQLKYDHAAKAVTAGIFEGYEDATLRPYGHLTRAEAAAVFMRFDQMVESLKQQSSGPDEGHTDEEHIQEEHTQEGDENNVPSLNDSPAKQPEIQPVQP